MFLFLLLVPQIIAINCISLTGFDFLDNKLERRFGPDNGYVTVRRDWFPDQLSACFRAFVRIDRFGGLLGYMDFTQQGQSYPFTSILGIKECMHVRHA